MKASRRIEVYKLVLVINLSEMKRKNRTMPDKPFQYVEPNNDVKKMESVVSTAKEFSEVTTIHGLPYILRPNHSIWAKMFWIIAVSVALVGTTFQVMSIWKIRQDSPVITYLDTISLPIEKIDFPAVTICPQGFISSIMDSALFYQFEKWLLEKKKVEEMRKKRSLKDDKKESSKNLTHDELTVYLHEFLSDVYPGAKDSPAKLVSLLISDEPDKTIQNEAIFVPEKELECDSKTNQFMIDHLDNKINIRCPHGFKSIGNGTCVMPGEIKMSYTNAANFCNAHNGASIYYFDTYEEIVRLDEHNLLGLKTLVNI